MEKVDKKIELIRRMQKELEHRTLIEEKAVQLIIEGKHMDAMALLNSLDDNVIAKIEEEIKAMEVLK